MCEYIQAKMAAIAIKYEYKKKKKNYKHTESITLKPTSSELL
jgi:hypothetical protein